MRSSGRPEPERCTTSTHRHADSDTDPAEAVSDDDAPAETFVHWSGYAPTRTVAGKEEPLNATQLRMEAQRFRDRADRYVKAGNLDTGANLRQAAADLEARAATLDKGQSSESTSATGGPT
jgi:hypothetical protein